MSSTRQFRFPGSSKGITVRYSDNSKNKQTGEIINRTKENERRERQGNNRSNQNNQDKNNRNRNNLSQQRNDRNTNLNYRHHSELKSNQAERDQIYGQF